MLPLRELFGDPLIMWLTFDTKCMLLLTCISGAIACSSESSEDGTVRLFVDGTAVTCSVGTGAGVAPRADETEASLICEHEYSSCSDQRVYSVACTTRQGSGETTCACYVDEEPTGATFTTSGECSLGPRKVATGCEWAR